LRADEIRNPVPWGVLTKVELDRLYLFIETLVDEIGNTFVGKNSSPSLGSSRTGPKRAPINQLPSP